jgi:hypothetical protein
MREIKFRAWDKFNKLIKESVMPSRRDYPESQYELMQFTGLKDKNGKEIYEGDICDLDGEKVKISWSNLDSGFCLEWGYKSRIGLSIHLEVIGNIYENPELLKRE